MSSSESPATADLGGASDFLSAIQEAALPKEAHARQAAAVLAFGRRANAQPPISILMQDAVALVSEVIGERLCGVGEVARNNTLMLKVATTNSQGRLVNPVTHEAELVAENSMGAFALQSGSPVTSADLVAERRFTDLFLRKLGVTSALTVPLHLLKEPVGTLSLYSHAQREFTEDDVRFTETIAHLLSSSIARVKAESEQARQREFASTLFDLVDAMVVVLDMKCNIKSINRACRAATGFETDSIRGKPFYSVFMIPEEFDLVRAILRKAVSGRSPVEFESQLLTKDSQRRRVAWSLKIVRQGEDGAESVVLSGTDRTELLEMQAELEHAKAANASAHEAVQKLKAERDEAVAKPSDRGRSAPPAEGDGESPTTGSRNAPEPSTDDLNPFQRVEGDNGLPDATDKRTSPRRRYKYRQSIAPMYGGVIPPRRKFFEVICEDISGGGISFYLDQAPDFDQLVVALGRPPLLTYFTAEVVRTIERVIDGYQVYLVGCRFMGRVHV